MYMPGTVAPEQVQQQGMQQALIEALRQPQQSLAPTQAGNVVSASGGLNAGLDASAIGGALRGPTQNIGTAMNYGTNPFSQQTNMLAAQDAVFR